MERECSITPPEESTRESGSTTRSTVMESSSMPTETDTKGPGEMGNVQITVYTNIQMEMSMTGSGAMTPRKVRGNWTWLLATNTREIGKLVRKMAKVVIFLFRSVYLCQWGHL